MYGVDQLCPPCKTLSTFCGQQNCHSRSTLYCLCLQMLRFWDDNTRSHIYLFIILHLSFTVPDPLAPRVRIQGPRVMRLLEGERFNLLCSAHTPGGLARRTRLTWRSVRPRFQRVRVITPFFIVNRFRGDPGHPAGQRFNFRCVARNQYGRAEAFVSVIYLRKCIQPLPRTNVIDIAFHVKQIHRHCSFLAVNGNSKLYKHILK